jgi:DNA primase
MPDSREKPVEGNSPKVEISSPDKVMYPETGFTKRDVADYYTAGL